MPERNRKIMTIREFKKQSRKALPRLDSRLCSRAVPDLTIL